MLKKRLCVSIVLLIFFLISKVYGEDQNKKFRNGKVMLFDQTLSFNVEIARTELQRNIGLMYRKFLPQYNGMLFIFEEEVIQRVWMKNTLISLDVIFISAENNVVSIIKNLQPCSKQLCRIFESAKKSKYMLELNAGMVQKNGIKIGQKILFEW
ncbi:MAG: DUF192 domain-containing protein [Methylococcales bacterium]|nr:DUF192 domain-containing protein [Methylococcales bacterium]